LNIVLLLANGGRAGDALLYARAALHHFERVGLGATQGAAEPRDLIALRRTLGDAAALAKAFGGELEAARIGG
jgi:hypothetical protein